MIVRFKKAEMVNRRRYNAGDVAQFTDADAEMLEARGTVEILDRGPVQPGAQRPVTNLMPPYQAPTFTKLQEPD